MANPQCTVATRNERTDRSLIATPSLVLQHSIEFGAQRRRPDGRRRFLAASGGKRVGRPAHPAHRQFQLSAWIPLGLQPRGAVQSGSATGERVPAGWRQAILDDVP